MVADRPTKASLDLAVRALVRIAAEPSAVMRSEAIADEIGAHPVVLRRVLGRLRRSGIVEGRSGPGGGWAIARDPARLAIGAVYLALSEPVLGDRRTTDRLALALQEADTAFVASLDRLTIADVMDTPSKSHS